MTILALRLKGDFRHCRRPTPKFARRLPARDYWSIQAKMEDEIDHPAPGWLGGQT